MSQENQITLRGYLTAEPKLYQKTSQTVPLAELRVGCTPRRLNHETGEWQELPTSYYRVKCWRRLAINAVSSLHKGDRVLIRGRFYMNSWIDNQQRQRSTLEIEADTLGHDLAYGWSHYLRGTRSSGDGAAVNSGEMARQYTATAVADDGYDTDPSDPQAGRQVEPPESEEAMSGADGQDGLEGILGGEPEAEGVPGADDMPSDTDIDSRPAMEDESPLVRESMSF